MKEEGRRKKEEGRRKKEEGSNKLSAWQFLPLSSASKFQI
jgi:hypothetical protein